MLRLILIVLICCFHTTVFANEAINQTLDNFHKAASEANYKAYFSLLAEDAVFLGTDGKERWTKAEFQQFVKPYFSKGRGWTYKTTQRNISPLVSQKVFFFDEVLMNDNYGQCRGSGVIIYQDNMWKIAQYNLSIPVPNKLSKTIVDLIKGATKGAK